MSRKFIVADPEDYATFTSFETALQHAKDDVGLDGMWPCKSLVVCEVVAIVKERKVAPVVKVTKKR